MKRMIFFLLLLTVAGGSLWRAVTNGRHDPRKNLGGDTASITLLFESLPVFYDHVEAKTVGEFLRKEGFTLLPEDQLTPGSETKLTSGMRIAYDPARPVSIAADGKTWMLETAAHSAAEILQSANVTLDQDDIVKPAREEIVPAQGKILVTRVQIEEEKKSVPIPYSTQEKEDPKLSWRKKVVEQKGENGIKETIYRVSYYNGKEVSRHLLSTTVVKDPVDEIVTQGTLVKVGKAHSGGASWYAFTGTMAAANPWLPLGSYVRVTNTANGKSVIVKINDRGPFVAGRIIDLDKVAFQKIASLGAGVINVKMEEITN